jgi:hypothetical protein
LPDKEYGDVKNCLSLGSFQIRGSKKPLHIYANPDAGGEDWRSCPLGTLPRQAAVSRIRTQTCLSVASWFAAPIDGCLPWVPAKRATAAVAFFGLPFLAKQKR